MVRTLTGLLTVLMIGALSLTAAAQPHIEVSTDAHNFGRSAPGVKLYHQVVVSNTGDQPLILNSVETTCGCTAAIASATTIAAGATGAVDVTMTASSHTTRMQKQVRITSNDPTKPELLITLFADVRDGWELSPQVNFRFSETPFDGEDSMTLFMKNEDGAPFKVLETRVDDSHFTVEAGESSASGVPITVHFKAGKEAGAITANIEIITDYSVQPTKNVSAYATVVGPIVLKPATLFFGRQKGGQVIDRELRLALRNQEDFGSFTVSGVDAPDGGVSVEQLGDNGRGEYRLKISYTIPEEPGYHRGKLIIHTSLKSQPEVEVNYSVLVPKS